VDADRPGGGSDVIELTKTAEILRDFDDEDPNWIWCMAHASFAHREACEFILYIGSDDHSSLHVEHMRKGGCTDDFVAAYLAAKDAGAVRVIFYC